MKKKSEKKKTAHKKKGIVKKLAKAPKKAKPIGKVTHYFGNLKVAVVKLSAPLKKGQRIRVAGGENTDFTQTVTSMQSDHRPIVLAKKGKSVGIKMPKRAREGYRVFAA